MEDKVLIALGVDPTRCFISDKSIVGDFYYYHFDDYNINTKQLFDDIVKKASEILNINIKNTDYIVDIANLL